jgi:dihydrodipicolinate synthase/N-acetylneuraminate lyase
VRTQAIGLEDFRGVLPVPPLCRDNQGRLDFDESDKVVRHIAAGGIRTFLYGGNAFLYHLTLAEYDALVYWLRSFNDSYWAIPSAGPSYGRALDQAPLLRKAGFPCVRSRVSPHR